VTRDLRPLFDPRSVAVLGASNDPAKWGNWLARGALAGGHRRAVYLVNRKGGEILGQPAYRSLAELPEPPELVALTVPALGFGEAVEASLAAGARALVAITAGLGESGEDGRAQERAVVERVRAEGAVLLGPNCLGVFDASTELQLASNRFEAGPIGLISQSGNLALEIGLRAADIGLGLSRFVSLGNQADLDVAELVAELAAHEPTRVVALYCEDFRDGRAFARAAAESGKPVVLLTVGASAAGARAARSHTGALASDSAAVDAACRAAGIVRVSTPAELVDVAQAVLAGRRPRGRRVAIVADGGGHGAVAADVAAAGGLEVPPCSDRLAGELAAHLPPTASTRNPVDFAGGGEQDVWSFHRAIGLLLSSDEIDSVLLTGYFGGYEQYGAELLERELEVGRAIASSVAESGKPLHVHTMYSQSAAASELREGSVPVYGTIEAAAGALAALAGYALAARGRVPELPEPVELPPGLVENYWSARELLSAAGIRFVEARRVRSLDQARAAARELGYPVVLKAAGLLHKSDEGGVAVGLADDEELEHALARMTTLGPEYSVERAAPVERGVELIVGARRDPRFGPVVLVGLGGVYAELIRDVAVALAPVDEAEAAALLRSLAGAPLLLGARGRPSLDLAAAARAASALSAVAAAHPDLEELEINPLLVTADGALGLDARLVRRQKGGERAD
jgi:acyl-CoA synthetase (NDP forming)